MQFGNTTDHGQSPARSAALRRGNQLERLLSLLVRQRRSGIGDFQLHSVRPVGRGCDHGASLRHRIHGVEHQIPHGSTQQFSIGGDRLFPGNVDDRLDRLLFQTRLQWQKDLLDQFPQGKSPTMFNVRIIRHGNVP